MVNKKIAYGFLGIIFFLSTFFSYLVFSQKESPKLISSFLSSDNLKEKNNSSLEKTIEDNEPKTEECPLNGELYSKKQKEKWEKRRPLGVMIENHKEARPQSGLSSADVIFEAVAEGGITRFLAVFYCQDASFIGPIRSARIYFIHLLEGFGNYPLYAHVGGANTPGPADALGYLSKIGWTNYNDLNQFSVPFPYFWRDYQRLPNRAAEHTVYSSTEKLWQYAKEKRKLTQIDEDQVLWSKDFNPWNFSDDAQVEERSEIKKVDFGFWSNLASDFKVSWLYDKTKNSYKRENGGVAHLDKNTGKQIEAKNVVIIFTDESPANDGYEGGHLLYKTIGQGEALIFQNGKVIEGKWSRKKYSELIRFYDQNEKEISFVRGQIFIEILPIGNKVLY